MTKKQIINLVAVKAHLPKKASREAIDTLLSEITKALKKGEKVVLSGFGTFYLGQISKDKTVIVPRKGQKMVIKAHRVARFAPGKPLKKVVK